MFFKLKIIALLFCAAPVSAVFAQTTWTGAISSNWDTEANWSAGVPDANDHVTIPNEGNSPVIAATAAAKSVHVQSGASLLLNSGANLTLGGFFSLDGAILTQSLLNSGTVTNNGSIILNNSTDIGGMGLHNEGGSFENGPSGAIAVDAAVIYGISNSAGTFTNLGNISIGNTTGANTGILNIATFNNEPGAQISLNRMFFSIMENSAGTFNNKGKMTLGALAAPVTEQGILNSAMFNNFSGGEIAIDRTNSEGLSNLAPGTFTNAGKLVIGAIADVGSYGLYNLGQFFNNTGGEINIDRANFNGLYNIQQTFTNAGKITIGALANPGESGLENQGAFYNNAGGEIIIDRSGKAGLRNAFGHATFYNSAKITIGATAGVGDYALQTESPFYNYPGGEIRLDRSSVAGIHTKVSYAGATSILDNAGTILIGAAGSVGTYGVHNETAFHNTQCEALLDILSNNVIGNTGTFHNTEGRIVERASGNSSISTNAGTVHNLNGGTFSIGTNTGTLTTNTPPPTICCAPEFTQCPTSGITVNTTEGTCTAIADYTVAADGTAPVLTYVFSGQTSGSGTGSGSGAYFNLGGTNVAITATNICGAPTCTFTVTVVDNLPPNINCPGPVAKNTDVGQCGAVVNYTVTASDNCTYTLARTSAAGTASGASFPIGTTQVAWSATDGSGNTATCAFTVTVDDNQPPSIQCPANFSKNMDLGQCSAVVGYGQPSFSDNCPGATVQLISGLPSGSIFPQGMHTVQWKATDAAGFSAICQFTIDIVDNQSPNITCPANIIRSTDPSQCSAVVTYAMPTASDNCGNATLTRLSPDGTANGSAFPANATTTVLWQATDARANTSTCSFTITVMDTQAPHIACPPNIGVGTAPNRCDANVAYPLPTAADNCALAPNSPSLQSGPASGGLFPKGQTTVVWRATDATGLTKTCSFRVIVSDTESPVVTCPPNQAKNTDPGLCSAAVPYPTPTATDNCAPAPTVVRIGGPVSGSAFPAGNTTVVWRATDGAGRSATCTFLVTVTDNQPPTIVCPHAITTVGSGTPCMATVYYSNPVASDNCANIPSLLLLEGLSSSSPFPAGETTNTWRAIAPNGQTAECSFKVTVNCPSARGTLALKNNAPNDPLDWALSPNPARLEAVVSLGSDDTTAPEGHVAIYDALGRLVWQRPFEGQRQLTVKGLASWPPGLYVVALRAANGQLSAKQLVVE